VAVKAQQTAGGVVEPARDEDRRVISAEVATALAPVLGGIGTHVDPFERIALANHYVDALRHSVSDGAAVRRAAVRELRAAGMTLREIAGRTGLTPARIGQIEQGIDGRTRAAPADAPT
jgi:hypothetical protein